MCQAERLQAGSRLDWGRCGASGGAPKNLRVGGASRRKHLPSGKGQPPGGSQPEWGGVLGAGHCPPRAWGGGWGWG